MSGNGNESSYITVGEGLEIVLAAGIKMTRPTVLRFFKGSRAVRLIGGRYFLPKQDFLNILEGKEYGADEEPNGAGGADYPQAGESNPGS